MFKRRSNSLSIDDVALKRHSVDSTATVSTVEEAEEETVDYKSLLEKIYEETACDAVVAKLVDCFFENRVGRILAKEAADDIKRTLSKEMQMSKTPRVTYAISKARWDTSVQVDRSIMAMLEARRMESTTEAEGASFVKIRESGWVYLSTLCTQEYANKFFGYSSYH